MSSLNPSTYGQAVSFAANVAVLAPGAGNPSGTVQFVVDGGNFGSPITLAAGSATSSSISTLTEGTHSVSAIYSRRQQLLNQQRGTDRRPDRQSGQRNHGSYFQPEPVCLRAVGNTDRDNRRPVRTGQRAQGTSKTAGCNWNSGVEREYRMRNDSCYIG